MSAESVWIEYYLERHGGLVSFDCDERGPRAVAVELSDKLGISYQAVVAAMKDRMFFLPSNVAGLEAA